MRWRLRSARSRQESNPPPKPVLERRTPISRRNLDKHQDSRWVADFSVRIRSRGYQPPENHWWEVSLSTGIDITKHYAVDRDPSLRALNQHKLPRKGPARGTRCSGTSVGKRQAPCSLALGGRSMGTECVSLALQGRNDGKGDSQGAPLAVRVCR